MLPHPGCCSPQRAFLVSAGVTYTPSYSQPQLVAFRFTPLFYSPKGHTLGSPTQTYIFHTLISQTAAGIITTTLYT